MINQEGLDLLSESVAKQLHIDTGMECGHVARIDTVGQRALFAFKLLSAMSHQEVPLAKLSEAHSWQGIFETLVRQALEDTAPWALARKVALRKAGEFLPDIPPVIDQQGRRHFRMFAEGGTYLSKGNNAHD